MFLKSQTELPLGFPAISRALGQIPADTIVEVAADVQRRGQKLLVDIDLAGIAAEFEERPQVEVGERSCTDRTASLPFRLVVKAGGRVIWSMDGSLDAAWLGPHLTHLALSVQYEMPHIVIAGPADRALLHRVAEVTAQRFVETAAQRLMD
jgi:hypothetical protein